MFNHKQSLLLLLAVSAASALAYTPIVLVHGVLSDDYGMAPTEHYIRKHMGDDVYIKNVQLGFGEISSLTSIYHQAEYLRDAIVNDPMLKDGLNIIAHSQGGLVARYYLQKHNSPQVHTYISWGSPQQGVFGLPGTYDDRMIWLDALESYVYKFIYAKPLQKYIGAASYWHDTLHMEKYLAKSAFLPFINNEKEHPDAELFKQNICSVKNMVFVMSEKEEIVEPRISCHFGFYKKGSKTEIENLVDSEEYKNDVLGLRTLNESGRLHLLLADCDHAQFQEDEKNFLNTLPFLVADPEQVPLNQEAITLAQAENQATAAA